MNWLLRIVGGPLRRTFYQDEPGLVATTFEGGHIPDDIGTPDQIAEGDPGAAHGAPAERHSVDRESLEELDESSWEGPTRLPDESEKEPGLHPDRKPPEGEAKSTEDEPTPEVSDTERAAALKKLGIEGHDSIDSYFDSKLKEVRAADAARLKMLLGGANVELKSDDDMDEVLGEVEQRVLAQRGYSQGGDQRTQAKSAAGAGSEDANPLDDLIGKYAQTFNWTDDWKGFIGDFGGVLADAVSEAIDEIHGEFSARADLSEARQWYAEAKAGLGEGETGPSFKEAWAIMRLNPGLAQRARDRYEVFQDVDVNPMKDAFAKWRGTQTATGLTKGEQQKRDEQARKVRDLKKLGRGSRTPKPRPSAAQEMGDMEAALDKIPAW